MTIDWNSFTAARALAGGALIGLAAAIFLLANGRIAGISGIVAGLLRPVSRDWQWRAAFLAGMVLAPIVARLGVMPKIEVAASPVTLIVAGFLVGIGTRYGSGCTSGHGVCGLSRLSLRSLAATIAFMATGFMTVYVVRHGLSG
jgi:uncharacterized membrane protein YedE/YeeE